MLDFCFQKEIFILEIVLRLGFVFADTQDRKQALCGPKATARDQEAAHGAEKRGDDHCVFKNKSLHIITLAITFPFYYIFIDDV